MRRRSDHGIPSRMTEEHRGAATAVIQAAAGQERSGGGRGILAMRLMAIEMCMGTPGVMAWIGARARSADEASALAFASAVEAPEGWFVHAALGVVLLGVGAMAWSLRRHAREQASARRRREAGSDRYEAIFHAMPFPAFCKDASGGYLAVNRAYEDAFGIEAQRLIGRDLAQTRHLDLDCERMHAAHLRVIRTATSASDDLILSDVRHGARAFRLWLIAMRPRLDGVALLGIVMAADRPPRPAETVCAPPRTVLDQALLSAVSHDVRTPLTGIMGALELLGYAELTTRQRALVSGAENASRALQDILDDLLALARLETEGTVRPDQPIDLRGLLAGLLAKHGTGGGVLDLDERLAPRLMGDGHALRRALGKLLVHYFSLGLGRAPRWDVRVLAQGAQWQSIELVLAPLPATAAQAEASAPASHGNQLAWIAACKLCESMGFSLREQGSGGTGPRFVMHGSLPLAADVTRHETGGGAQCLEAEELARLAREDAGHVARRLADVFGDDAGAIADYLHLVRNEEQRLQANLDAGDASRLREVAHYLSGMGSFFGAQRLASMATALELGRGRDEVIERAEALRIYLTCFIESLHGNTCEATAITNNTMVISDVSHGKVSSAALEL